MRALRDSVTHVLVNPENVHPGFEARAVAGSTFTWRSRGATCVGARHGWRDAGGRPERRGAPALCRWGKTLRSGEPVEARRTGRAVNGHKRQPGSLGVVSPTFFFVYVTILDAAVPSGKKMREANN